MSVSLAVLDLYVLHKQLSIHAAEKHNCTAYLSTCTTPYTPENCQDHKSNMYSTSPQYQSATNSLPESMHVQDT